MSKKALGETYESAGSDCSQTEFVRNKNCEKTQTGVTVTIAEIIALKSSERETRIVLRFRKPTISKECLDLWMFVTIRDCGKLEVEDGGVSQPIVNQRLRLDSLELHHHSDITCESETQSCDRNRIRLWNDFA